MSSNIFTPTEDLWLFEFTGSSLTYSLISKPVNINKMAKVLSIIDTKNQIHLFILDEFQQAFHVIWDNYVWQKQILPFKQWDHLLTFIDCNNNLSFLVKDSNEIRVWMWDSAKYSSVKLNIKSSNLKPLYLTIDSSYIYLYLIDSERDSLTVSILSRETGDNQSDYTLLRFDNYHVHRCWVVNDSMILVSQDRLSDKRIKLMLIDLNSKESRQKQYEPLNLDKNTTYHLLVDKKKFLILASCYHYFYHTISFDGGKQWTNPQESILFSPILFSDITSVNNSPTALISLRQMRGQTLQYPIVLSLSEISNMVLNNKVLYKDSVVKPRKLSK